MRVKVLANYNMKLPSGKIIRVGTHEFIMSSEQDLLEQSDEIKNGYIKKYSNTVFCSFDKYTPIEEDVVIPTKMPTMTPTINTQDLTESDNDAILENNDTNDDLVTKPIKNKKTK